MNLQKLIASTLTAVMLFQPLLYAEPYRQSSDDVYVQGYYRQDGTYVPPHFRSQADGIVTNNYSYRPPTMNLFNVVGGRAEIDPNAASRGWAVGSAGGQLSAQSTQAQAQVIAGGVNLLGGLLKAIFSGANRSEPVAVQQAAVYVPPPQQEQMGMTPQQQQQVIDERAKQMAEQYYKNSLRDDYRNKMELCRKQYPDFDQYLPIMYQLAEKMGFDKTMQTGPDLIYHAAKKIYWRKEMRAAMFLALLINPVSVGVMILPLMKWRNAQKEVFYYLIESVSLWISPPGAMSPSQKLLLANKVTKFGNENDCLNDLKTRASGGENLACRTKDEVSSEILNAMEGKVVGKWYVHSLRDGYYPILFFFSFGGESQDEIMTNLRNYSSGFGSEVKVKIFSPEKEMLI